MRRLPEPIVDPVTEVVGKLLKEDIEAASGVLRPVTVRLLPKTLALVDAMAGYAGASRQSMLRDLLAAGMAAVRANLPDHVVADINEDAVERYERMEHEVGGA